MSENGIDFKQYLNFKVLFLSNNKKIFMAATAHLEFPKVNGLGKAETVYPIHNLISSRRSVRAFSSQSLSSSEINTILEAASWAPSSMNEQPWEYIYAHKGTEGFKKILGCLMEGNQKWAKDAPVLVISIAKTQFSRNQKRNSWAAHDVGMANANLLLQAVSMDIFGRAMGGFHKYQLAEEFDLKDDQNPICVIALGFREDVANMDGETKEREFSIRSRKPLDAFTRKLT